MRCKFVQPFNAFIDWDPSSWNMPEKHAERRRSVFWELYTLDKWKVCTCSLKCRTFPLCLLVCSQSLWAPEGPLFSACMKWTAKFQKKLRRRPTKTAKYCTVVSFFHSCIAQVSHWQFAHFQTSSLSLETRFCEASHFLCRIKVLYRQPNEIFGDIGARSKST